MPEDGESRVPHPRNGALDGAGAPPLPARRPVRKGRHRAVDVEEESGLNDAQLGSILRWLTDVD